MLREVQDISRLVNVHYIRQKEPLGLGHAILCAKDFVGDEPFGVMLGDDIVVSEKPALKQPMEVYEQTERSVVGVQPVDPSQVNKYGIIAAGETRGKLHKLCDMVEKPDVDKAPSNLAILGRYVIAPGIFEILENTPRGKGGEIQLTDALYTQMKRDGAYAYEFEGKRYDVGDKLGFLQATVEFALGRDDLKEPFAEYLREIGKTL
ncbi:MAG: UTP--glucose-1-phosphate uridylyltransferase, partial [Christensenellaceae bacterium]|nr:UTP--glucose-1-phosphate uridylyltransferase [Christensenellaceae bacterium]